MNFIIAQVIGIVTAIIAIGCVQFKDERVILLGNCVSNILTATTCILLGGLAGAWICLVASVQTLLVFLINKKDVETARKGRRIIFIVFNIIYIVGTIITFQGWVDLAVLGCALLYTTSIIQENSSKMRTVIIGNLVLWVIYDFAIGAYTNMITHGMSLISTLTAKLRLDKKNKSCDR